MCEAAGSRFLPSTHLLARSVGHEAKTMAYVQAVADDGSPLKDPEGNPVYIPAPREAGKSTKVMSENELSAWDKL